MTCSKRYLSDSKASLCLARVQFGRECLKLSEFGLTDYSLSSGVAATEQYCKGYKERPKLMSESETPTLLLVYPLNGYQSPW